MITAPTVSERFEASRGVNNSAPPDVDKNKTRVTMKLEGETKPPRQKHSHSSVPDGYQQSALHTLTTCSRAFGPDSTTLAQTSVVHTDDSFWDI